jgi:hypothetical protein
MNRIAANYTRGSGRVPSTRSSGQQQGLVCFAGKKAKNLKSKRASKHQDAVGQSSAQSERTPAQQDVISEPSFASVQSPNTASAQSTSHEQQQRKLRRQDAFNERTIKSVVREESTEQGVAVSRLQRENVLIVCRLTSAGMAVIGVLATFLTPILLQKAGSGIESVSQESLLHLPSLEDVAIAVAAGCSITAARFLAMQRWEDLAQSTNAANAQVWQRTSHFLFRAGKRNRDGHSTVSAPVSPTLTVYYSV